MDNLGTEKSNSNPNLFPQGEAELNRRLDTANVDETGEIESFDQDKTAVQRSAEAQKGIDEPAAGSTKLKPTFDTIRQQPDSQMPTGESADPQALLELLLQGKAKDMLKGADLGSEARRAQNIALGEDPDAGQ